MLSWIGPRAQANYTRDSRVSPGASLKSVFGYIALVVTCWMIGICSPFVWAQNLAAGSQAEPTSDQGGITIGPGDLIDLSVFHVPELVLKVRVDSNGFVSLPLLGDLKLAGMTVRDAQGLIARELVQRQMVIKPEVSLFVEEYATQGITVYGEVNSPGNYPLLGPHRLYDAISAAGGLSPKAGHTVTILRKGGPDPEVVIDLSGGETQQQSNVPISPGDTIVVSRAGVVYVLGEVNKPGAFLMENGTSISVMKAIALAGSTTKLASLKHAIIIRKSPEGSVEMEVSLDKVYHGKSSDLALHPEDIVFVPLSNVKNYGAMGIQAAIEAAVYSVYAFELKP